MAVSVRGTQAMTIPLFTILALFALGIRSMMRAERELISDMERKQD